MGLHNFSCWNPLISCQEWSWKTPHWVFRVLFLTQKASGFHQKFKASKCPPASEMFLFFFLILTQDIFFFFIAFREREGETKGETSVWERSINQLPPVRNQNRDPTRNWACALTRNSICNHLVTEWHSAQLSHTSQCETIIFLNVKLRFCQNK